MKFIITSLLVLLPVLSWSIILTPSKTFTLTKTTTRTKTATRTPTATLTTTATATATVTKTPIESVALTTDNIQCGTVFIDTNNCRKVVLLPDNFTNYHVTISLKYAQQPVAREGATGAGYPGDAIRYLITKSPGQFEIRILTLNNQVINCNPSSPFFSHPVTIDWIACQDSPSPTPTLIIQ